MKIYVKLKISLGELTNKYQDLYDFAPVGYVTLNDKGLILEANLHSGQTLFWGRGSA